ncbi:STAS domain-containing protein [Streptomyces sp. ActVer]|uniref:STAS domain-containing protein n=1 Tax=Streptomyces sp. ActVer TaxID=3014558 RepID=UPI0022B30A71|nr:STAS domain-containing protein [Streptomyces sp. ActVer]MCZ4508205.1 STAS domain-containing protein [Streptomyces sp. ActVer]
MNELGPQPLPCLRARVVGSTTVVRLCGEIDILTAAPLSVRLDALTAGPSPELVLDLRPVTFIDCSGLAALCRARKRTRIRGGRLRLVTGSPSILRLLRLTDLARAFEVYPRLSDALAGTPGKGDALASTAG